MDILYTPTQKVDAIFSCCKEIYKSIGKNEGSDLFLTCFIFVLVKSKVLNLYLHNNFIKKYYVKYSIKCEVGCTHMDVDDIQICCYKFQYELSEIEYYLTVFDSALNFIERMEFCNLDITKEEFDKNIANWKMLSKEYDVQNNNDVKLLIKAKNKLKKMMRYFPNLKK